MRCEPYKFQMRKSNNMKKKNLKSDEGLIIYLNLKYKFAFKIKFENCK